MRELERMGFTVGEFTNSPDWFYEEGGFDISAEGDVKDDPVEYWINYYGRFGGDTIHPELYDMADDYGYYFEWHNAAILSAAPNH